MAAAHMGHDMAATGTATTSATQTTRARRQPARPTPREQDILRAHYDGTGAKTIRLALTFNVSRSTVCRWAKRLDLTRPQHTARRWSAREIEKLDAFISKSSVKDLSLRLDRTPRAIALACHRLDLRKTSHDYTAASLAEAVGCSPHTVTSWVTAGWLDGGRRKSARTERQGGDFWRFSDADVARLLMEHPADVFPRGPNAEQWIWAAKLMAKGAK